MTRQNDFYRKFEGMKPEDRKELETEKGAKIGSRVRIMWADPFFHFPHLIYSLEERVGNLECKTVLDVGGKGEPGSIFELSWEEEGRRHVVEVFRAGTDPSLIPEGESYDICLVSKTHEKRVYDELFPFTDFADYTLYRDCCHGKGVREAAALGATHAVSDVIGYSLLAEMAVDIARNEYEYLSWFTDFAKAAEIAKQRGDKRKEELYAEFERRKME